MRKFLTPFLMGLTLAVAPISLVGCNQEGPVEEAGDEVDEAADEVQDEVDEATDES